MAKVTVGIPTFNNPAGLKRTLQCIVNQTHVDLEIIVSDNNSQTDTMRVVQQVDDPRIICYKQPKNIGALRNFEFVLSKATGDYFMWAADDDSWEKTYVSDLLAILVMYPNAIVAASNYKKFTEDGELKGLEQLTDTLHELGYADIIDAVFSLKKINVATYGLFRRKELQRILKDGFHRCDAPDRILFGDVAFGDHTVVLTNEYLYSREIHRRSFAVRNGIMQSKYLGSLVVAIARGRYYAEWLKILVKNRRHGGKRYFLRRFIQYVALVEFMLLKRLPITIFGLVPYGNRIRRVVKKCVA